MTIEIRRKRDGKKGWGKATIIKDAPGSSASAAIAIQLENLLDQVNLRIGYCAPEIIATENHTDITLKPIKKLYAPEQYRIMLAD